MNQAGDGILIHIKQSGDSNSGRPTFVTTLLTRDYGLITAMFKASKKDLQILQLGNVLSFTRYRRLETQMGTFSLELLKTPSALCFYSLVGLQGISYACELLFKTLKSGEAHPRLYDATFGFLTKIDEPNFWMRVSFYELTLLKSIGYGLSLDTVDAVRDHDKNTDESDLLYVSPKSGRAVSERAGMPYQSKLLALPHIFGGKSTDFLDVFALTGHFLKKAIPLSRLKVRITLIDLGKQTNFEDA
jgi:DNA repair protein RecO (recombination protein O)